MRRSLQYFVIALTIYLVCAISVIAKLIGTGSWLATVAGAVIVAIPLLGFWYVWKDFLLRRGVDAMNRALDQDPAGVIDGEKPDPNDWRSWYALSASYEAEGNSKRARAALRHALRIFNDDKRVTKSSQV